jgi:hypothetical protein
MNAYTLSNEEMMRTVGGTAASIYLFSAAMILHALVPIHPSEQVDMIFGESPSRPL